MASSESYKDPDDMIVRGQYKSSPFGRAVFVGLRALDPLLQYSILSRHAGITWIPGLLGGALLPATGAEYLLRPANNGLIFDLPPYQSLLLAFSVGSVMKQSFWALAIGQEELSPGNAALISLFTTIKNSIISTAAMWTLTSVNPQASAATDLLKSPYVAVGLTMYVTGILAETISEIQRKSFKKDERNKGKPYSGGLFSLARNINYGAYAVWTAGFALVGGGPALALVIGGFHFWDFAKRAVPAMDRYCTKRVKMTPILPIPRRSKHS